MHEEIGTNFLYWTLMPYTYGCGPLETWSSAAKNGQLTFFEIQNTQQGWLLQPLKSVVHSYAGKWISGCQFSGGLGQIIVVKVPEAADSIPQEASDEGG